MKHNDDFPEPETMEEAQNRKLEVNRSILQIQSQLSFSERQQPARSVRQDRRPVSSRH